MRPSRSCNLLFIAASSAPGAGNPEDANAQGAGRGSRLPAPRSPLQAGSSRSARRPAARARQKLLLARGSHAPWHCRHVPTPNALFLVVVGSLPQNGLLPMSPTSHLRGAAAELQLVQLSSPPQKELVALPHSSEMTTTRCFCLLTPAAKTLCVVSGDSYLSCGVGSPERRGGVA